MQFRYDINGLRAIAVLSVVIFHFVEEKLPGGFIGVDVFFVISGYLMTSIIISKFDKSRFSLMEFYLARANRIIPALAFLCASLLLIGFFTLSPVEYSKLSKQAASSALFISNVIYYLESGYFSESSLENWLLHTWSLSVEWQFYLIYPIVLAALNKILTRHKLKVVIVVTTLLSMLLSGWLTQKNPSLSYYILPTRAWEMLVGGLAFLYPIKKLQPLSKILALLGVLLISVSCFIFSEKTNWPGFSALVPVAGAYLIIIANQSSNTLLNNKLLQPLGTWSYSIYLWHWPLVVFIHKNNLDEAYALVGFSLSIALGYLSYRFIETINFNSKIQSNKALLTNKPLVCAVLIALIGSLSFFTNGFIQRAPVAYQNLVEDVEASPFRNKCHTNKYRDPSEACEYFVKGNTTWATFGDSHSVELAYALSKKLKATDEGLKHFSFSGCRPSYGKNDDYSKCAKWYNSSIEFIANEPMIQNVVFVHRYSYQLVGGSNKTYPHLGNLKFDNKSIELLQNIDRAIHKLASSKRRVYVLYPIPELPSHVTKLIDSELSVNGDLVSIEGTERSWFEKRNEVIINHFKSTDYPDNVVLINPAHYFCGSEACFSTKGGRSLYFDDNHVSNYGASLIAEDIIQNKNSHTPLQ